MFRRLTKSRLGTALAILVFVIVFAVSVLIQIRTWPEIRREIQILGPSPSQPSPTMWLAAATIVTAIGGVIGTISTVILAWRADRRTAKESELKAKESELKLVQLHQQIKEMELKLNASADSKPKIFLGE